MGRLNYLKMDTITSMIPLLSDSLQDDKQSKLFFVSLLSSIFVSLNNPQHPYFQVTSLTDPLYLQHPNMRSYTSNLGSQFFSGCNWAIGKSDIRCKAWYIEGHSLPVVVSMRLQSQEVFQFFSRLNKSDWTEKSSISFYRSFSSSHKKIQQHFQNAIRGPAFEYLVNH